MPAPFPAATNSCRCRRSARAVNRLIMRRLKRSRVAAVRTLASLKRHGLAPERRPSLRFLSPLSILLMQLRTYKAYEFCSWLVACHRSPFSIPFFPFAVLSSFLSLLLPPSSSPLLFCFFSFL